VYDATQYLNEHPGGPQSITLVAGEDATEDFMAIHSSDAKRKLAQYHITSNRDRRRLTNLSLPPSERMETWRYPPTRQGCFQGLKGFPPCTDKNERELGLPIGQHVYVRLRRKNGGAASGELVQRAYTPVSKRKDRGFIDMLVKIYYPTEQFPSGGRMTLGFAELSIGDTVELKGPIGHFTWLGN
ncbi:hypothetical protein H0H93_001151, partial [Arthromyces matolae]